MKNKLNGILSKIYYNPSHPSSFSGVDRLWKEVSTLASKKDVLKWLQSQDTYTLHKPVCRRFQRNKYVVDNIDDLWQADLNDVKHIKKQNDGFNYILTVIDVFSKFAWALPIRSKTGTSICDAFSTILKTSKRIPVNLMTDKGTEFSNRLFQQFLNKKSIGYYHSNNPDTKAAIVERFNRTLKTKLWRYFTKHSTARYIDVLQDVVDSYNSAVHSTIKIAPRDVSEHNVLQVWENAYKDKSQKSKGPRLKTGDYVRISREKTTFRKGYRSNWTEEIFIIEKVIRRTPTVYVLKDLQNETIEGTFYEPELQKVVFSKFKKFKIDKILKTRGKGARKEVYVKWKGYSSKFNCYIPASSVEKL